MSVWITLSWLPLDCRCPNTLGKIAFKVGKPITLDKLTSIKVPLPYARDLLEIDASLDLDLDRSVKIKLPTGKLRDQLAFYEHDPKFCSTCKIFGHSTVGCNPKK